MNYREENESQNMQEIIPSDARKEIETAGRFTDNVSDPELTVRYRSVTAKRRTKGVSPFVQFLLYIFFSASVLFTTVCAVATNYLLQNDAFMENSEEVMERKEEELVFNLGKKLLYIYLNEDMTAVERYCENTNIKYAIYRISSGRCLGSNMSDSLQKQATILTYNSSSAGVYFVPGMENLRIKIYMDAVQEDGRDEFAFIHLTESLVKYRNYVVAGLIGGVGMSIILFIILIRFAFLKSVQGETILYKLPLDLFCVGLGWFSYYASTIIARRTWNGIVDDKIWFVWIWIAVSATLGILFLIHLVPRVRKDGWYRGTICYMICAFLSRIVEIWKDLFLNLPLIWRIGAIFIILSAVEFGVMWFLLPPGRDFGILIALWAAEKLIMVPLLLNLVMVFKKFHLAAKELASGNLKYQMDVKHMPRLFKNFSKDMNAVADSVSLAVDERMKSEHLKTELITNVSHDIKTPLTSIINFSDLIVKENSENPKIIEYAEHLYKQSTRLKKLIEDLMEASKASTGNLEVHPVRCDVRVLLGQCMGEYEQRLSEKDIDLIVRQCPEPLWIMADTKMLWRIFDNLMNNINKYAQSNTRVYLSTERKGDKVYIAFKNISKYPLEESAENLMERFVRGDLSRHTEGNGLGLSIVKSLMDLQGGEIELAVDGDLFKAILAFPVAPSL